MNSPLRNKKKELSINEYVVGIRANNRMILARAITLIESRKNTHQKIAQQIINKCLPYSGNSLRIGITGVPGVGKSTFIEAFGNFITQQKHKIGVLVIDPSSTVSLGSILGDKTRMESLSVNPNAYIRPTASAGTLGGVARATRETIILLEAAGYDTIVIETVGVGQSETTVNSMVDCFLLLMLAGAGDELQGIKRGIMEMADILLINKADGENIIFAEKAMNQYRQALHLFPPKSNNWIPKVTSCSAIESKGIEDVWKLLVQFQQHNLSNGCIDANRKKQAKYWLYETINNNILDQFYNSENVKQQLTKIEKKVLNGELNPFDGAALIVELYSNL